MTSSSALVASPGSCRLWKSLCVKPPKPPATGAKMGHSAGFGIFYLKSLYIGSVFSLWEGLLLIFFHRFVHFYASGFSWVLFSMKFQLCSYCFLAYQSSHFKNKQKWLYAILFFIWILISDSFSCQEPVFYFLNGIVTNSFFSLGITLVYEGRELPLFSGAGVWQGPSSSWV